MEIKRSPSQLHDLPCSLWPLSLSHASSTLTKSAKQNILHTYARASPAGTHSLRVRKAPSHRELFIHLSIHTYTYIYIHTRIYTFLALIAAIDRYVCFAGNFMACCRCRPLSRPWPRRYLCLAISINKRAAHSAINFSKYIFQLL